MDETRQRLRSSLSEFENVSKELDSTNTVLGTTRERLVQVTAELAAMHKQRRVRFSQIQDAFLSLSLLEVHQTITMHLFSNNNLLKLLQSAEHSQRSRVLACLLQLWPSSL